MSVADELRKLADLKSEGVLTDAEFQAQKSAVLAGDGLIDAAHHAESPKASILFRLLLGAGVVFGLLMILGQCSPSAESSEKQTARDTIKYCWSETERKALTPSEQRLTARTWRPSSKKSIDTSRR